MCGIVAYVGNKPAAPLLIEGLKRLEYRGYDSAGLAVLNGGTTETPGVLQMSRSVGRVSVLEEQMAADRARFDGTLGIAHTRWATHGSPTEDNAHPHTGTTKDGHTIALVHNGIIENYRALRTYLEKKGHVFTSETDTEVLAKLIAELYDAGVAGDSADGGAALERAVQTALREVTGAYAIAVTCEREPHTLVVAKKGSPLIVGVADHAYVVASDASAIVSHTTQAITLEDYQVVRLCAGPRDQIPSHPPTAGRGAWTSARRPSTTRRSASRLKRSRWTWSRSSWGTTSTTCSRRSWSSPRRCAPACGAASTPARDAWCSGAWRAFRANWSGPSGLSSPGRARPTTRA